MAYDTFKILIIDDDPHAVKLYALALLKQHYEVIEATSGKAGLEKAFQEDPDLVLLDIMMPGMDGYEVCHRLRASPRTADIPIMILTGLSGTAARQKAAEVGADDFVTKGEDLARLDGRIKMLIKQRILARTRSWLAELDGGVAIDRALRARLAAGLPLAVCYLDINSLASLNEWAGFEAGERVLWQLARILQRRVKEENQGDHVGYYGMDDFVVLTTPERAEPLAQSVMQAFDAIMHDWNDGASSGTSVPTLSAGIVLIENGRTIHPGQVSHLGQTLLRQAKTTPEHPVQVGRL